MERATNSMSYFMCSTNINIPCVLFIPGKGTKMFYGSKFMCVSPQARIPFLRVVRGKRWP